MSNSEVITTGAGDRYHADENCWALHAGRVGGEVQGYQMHDVHRFPSAEQAEAAGYTPCGVCVTRSDADRVTVIVLAVADGIGDEPDMAHVAIRGTNTSAVVPAARIAADSGVGVNELPGREFTAVLTVGERDDELTGFRLVNDPRE